MKGTLLTTLALSATAVYGAPHPSASFVEAAPVDARDLVNVRVALSQRNLEKGYDHVMAVSDPSSSKYGRHWTVEEVEAEFAPEQSSVDSVLDFLRKADISTAKQSLNKGWVTFEASIEQLESMLAAKVSPIKKGRHGSDLTLHDYQVPSHLQPHIDFITLAPSKQSALKKRDVTARSVDHKSAVLPRALPNVVEELANCGRNITPPCLQALYGIPPPSAPYLSAGDLGIFEFDSSYAQQDLDSYYTTYAPEIKNGTHPEVISINGAEAPATVADSSAEADLDFTMAYALLGPAEISFYDVTVPTADSGNYSFSQGLAALTDAVDKSSCTAYEISKGYQCGTTSLSKVLSISYTEPELFGAGQAFQSRICNEFMKLALQGHTILVSSGDYGIAGAPIYGDELDINNGCINQNYTNEYEYLAYNGTIFSPNFPANCPYVLTVGATMLQPGQNVLNAESAMQLPNEGFAEADHHVVFASGGGFANYFSRPSYQNAAVESYLKNHVPNYKSYVSSGQDLFSGKSNIGANDGVYNPSGRAYPDVSANGVGFSTYVMGHKATQDGTSAAAPLWASLIALINQKRGFLGKGPVGFVNPTLYQNPEIFHDIKNGSNPGCGTPGFSAVSGWDPVTGLGTPIFPEMEALFLALP